MFNLYILLISLFLSFSARAQVDSAKNIILHDTSNLQIWNPCIGIDSLQKTDSVVVTGKVIKGIASFYSSNLDGTETATGEIYRNSKLTGASNNLKLNTWVRVTNLKNGKTVIVRINDRMHPAMKKKGRVIDLSRYAAKKLDFIKDGLTKVKLEVIEPPKKEPKK